MKLTDEQIASIMTKEISCKTLIVSKEDAENIIKSHQKDGWELVNKTEISGRYKITFKK